MGFLSGNIIYIFFIGLMLQAKSQSPEISPVVERKNKKPVDADLRGVELLTLGELAMPNWLRFFFFNLFSQCKIISGLFSNGLHFFLAFHLIV